MNHDQDNYESEEYSLKGPSPRKKRRLRNKINIKVFLRSLLLTLLVAGFMIVAWRAGIFAVQYVNARHAGMSASEAASYAWSDSVGFFVDIADNISPVMLKNKNILVIGSDEKKVNADVIMLVQFDTASKSVDIVSVMRDTKVVINGRIWKINASLHMGGEAFLIKQVEDLLGVNIDNYVVLSYSGFKKAIDALGGVDFYVPQDMHYTDPTQNLYINLKEGQQHLNGDKAEQLVRFRHYKMGDVKRTEVQRDFMKALYKQKLNSSIVKQIPKLVPALMDFVGTDMGIQEALQYANFVSNFDTNALHTYQMPGVPKNIKGLSYFIADPDGITEMYNEIERSHQEKLDTDKNKKKETENVKTTSSHKTASTSSYQDDDVDKNGEAVTAR
ncbi:MAG: LCP family protein [Bacillota bacterium]|nr:LCP family protein [Bacillota bacterium]